MDGGVIACVEENSLAEYIGLEIGDKIISVNGSKVLDLIELQFAWADENVELQVEKRNGKIESFAIEKEYDEPLGVVFERAVFDRIIPCRNKCIFCFVDQMMPGLRSTLYIKDDDYRLSFLQGSFITLTNISEFEIERIKREHLSPLYVSVHTTDPLLREKLLNNPRAKNILTILEELSQAGISFHTQVVLCPGLNDGEYLEKTYQDLLGVEGVLSLAIVPVGLTKYRSGLPELRAFQPEEYGTLINWVQIKQEEARGVKGTSFVWLADEFYINAGRPLPLYDEYEDFPQLDNGIGVVRLLWEEFAQLELPLRLPVEKKLFIATGVSGEKVLSPIVERLNRIQGLRIEIIVIPNIVFGPTVTVTGLITGTCLLAGLSGIKEGSTVLICSQMLKVLEGKFLDDITIEEVEDILKINLESVPADAAGLVEKILAL